MGRRCDIGRKISRGEKLFVLQIIRRGVVRREATRHAAELFAADRSKQVTERTAPNDFEEGPGILCDVASHCVQVFGKRHVEAAANKHFRRSNMNVEPRTLVLAKT